MDVITEKLLMPEEVEALAFCSYIDERRKAHPALDNSLQQIETLRRELISLEYNWGENPRDQQIVQ